MKHQTMTTLKKYFSLLLLLLVIGSAGSCDTIVSQLNELPETEDEGASNSNDPSDPSYRLPGIRFTNTGFSLDNPFEVTQREITLEWDVISDAGFTIDDFGFQYSYRYASPEESIQSKSFQPVNDFESITISNLHETFGDELYTFEILAEYTPENSSIVKDTTFTGQFSVNAFQSRGFLFNPQIITSNNDGSYTARIYLDEVQESDDLTGFSLVINYTSSYFDLTEEDIRIIDDSNSFLNSDGNATVISFAELSTNMITIDVGVAGSNATPLSGGGAICEITFVPNGNFPGNTNLFISSSSVLKTSEGFDIEIQEYTDAEILQ